MNDSVSIGLGDIEIMHSAIIQCSKRHCGYCYIALEHFAVVNRANITSKYDKSHIFSASGIVDAACALNPTESHCNI